MTVSGSSVKLVGNRKAAGVKGDTFRRIGDKSKER